MNLSKKRAVRYVLAIATLLAITVILEVSTSSASNLGFRMRMIDDGYGGDGGITHVNLGPHIRTGCQVLSEPQPVNYGVRPAKYYVNGKSSFSLSGEMEIGTLTATTSYEFWKNLITFSQQNLTVSSTLGHNGTCAPASSAVGVQSLGFSASDEPSMASTTIDLARRSFTDASGAVPYDTAHALAHFLLDNGIDVSVPASVDLYFYSTSTIRFATTTWQETNSAGHFVDFTQYSMASTTAYSKILTAMRSDNTAVLVGFHIPGPDGILDTPDDSGHIMAVYGIDTFGLFGLFGIGFSDTAPPPSFERYLDAHITSDGFLLIEFLPGQPQETWRLKEIIVVKAKAIPPP